MSNRYHYSITDDPQFRKLVLGLGLLIGSCIYEGYIKSGIIGGIIAGVQATYGLILSVIFISIAVGSVVWALYKWRLILMILTKTAKWIWTNFSSRRL